MKSPRQRPDSPRRERNPACWCGNEDLKPFSDDYLRCAKCETLLLRRPPKGDISHVRDEKNDLYGKNYYLTRLPEDHGYPDLATRARLDLPERCMYWLRTVLKYKLPPARVLELGSAHGGFVALLRSAGFDATGLELSPWLAKFARRTFDVPTLIGPIEDQKIRARSLDVIALMDVLEHLPDPLNTMRVCLKLLKPNGLLAIQTPHYLAGKTLEDLTTPPDRFLEQLKPDQHLYLFSQQSIREMFHRLSADFVVFEPAIFAHYDMFLIVGGLRLPVFSPEKIQQALTATPGGRVVQALIDLDDQVRDLRARYTESESDRAARLQVIHQQGQRAAELEAEVHHWLEETKKYSAQAQQSESLRAGLNGLQAELEQARIKSEVLAKEKHDLLGQLDKARHALAAAEADHTRLSADLATSADRLVRLQTELEQAQTKGEALAKEKLDLLGQLDKARHALAAAEADRTRLSADLATSADRLVRLQTELERQKNTSESLAGEIHTAKEQNRTLTARLDAQSRALDGTVKSLEAARTRIRELQEQLSAIEEHALIRVLKACRLRPW